MNLKQSQTVQNLKINLKNLYETIYKLFPQEAYPELYYTEEELEELKRDSRNIFLKEGENIEQCIS